VTDSRLPKRDHRQRREDRRRGGNSAGRPRSGGRHDGAVRAADAGRADRARRPRRFCRTNRSKTCCRASGPRHRCTPPHRAAHGDKRRDGAAPRAAEELARGVSADKAAALLGGTEGCSPPPSWELSRSRCRARWCVVRSSARKRRARVESCALRCWRSGGAPFGIRYAERPEPFSPDAQRTCAALGRMAGRGVRGGCVHGQRPRRRRFSWWAARGSSARRSSRFGARRRRRSQSCCTARTVRGDCSRRTTFTRDHRARWAVRRGRLPQGRAAGRRRALRSGERCWSSAVVVRAVAGRSRDAGCCGRSKRFRVTTPSGWLGAVAAGRSCATGW